MTKRVIVLILAILFFAFFESNYPQSLKLFGVTPNLLIIFVVFFNIYFRRRNAFLFTILCGVTRDVLGLARFGTDIISFIICGFVVNKIKSSIYHNDRLSQIIIVFLIAFLNSLIFYFLNLDSIKLSFFRSLFFIMLPESLYTTVLGPLIFNGLKKCV